MHTTRPALNRRPPRGVTLIETLCVASIIAITVGLAAPNFSAWQDRQALNGAAAQLETDIQYARSQAVATSTVVRLSVRVESGGACYIVHSGLKDGCSCDPNGTATCTDTALVWRHATFPVKSPVRFMSRSVSIAFDPEHGTVTPTTTFKLQAGAGKTLHQVVNIMGRVRTCSPDQASGVKPC